MREKEGKERKKGQICKVKQRQMKKIYLHQRLTARGKEQQEKQTKEIKNYINQLRTKLTKVQTGKQDKSKAPSGE